MPSEHFHLRLTRFCQDFAAQLPIVYRNSVRLLLFVGNVLLATLASVLLLPSIWLIHHVSQNDEHQPYLIALLILSLACLAALSSILRAVPVIKRPPAGIRLNVHDAPELFALLDEESRRAGCILPIRHVWINDEYGLYSSQRRLFGFPVRHQLHIGLPLLQTIDKKHFRLLLAYQMAHLAAGYTGSNDEFAHHRMRWQQIAATQQQYALMPHLLSPFYQGFMPFFEVWIHALTRQQVLFTDMNATRHFPLNEYAQAMSHLHAYSHYFEQIYWSEYWQQADQTPQPEPLPYAALPSSAAQYTQHNTNLQRLQAEPAYTHDTHPTLSWRLQMLQTYGQLPHLDEDKAFDLLGKSGKTVLQILDKKWWRENSNTWQAQFEEAQIAREKLAQLNENATNLDVASALERAWLTEWLDKLPEVALAQLCLLHQQHPNHPHVIFAYARLLLNHDSADGLPLMEQVCQIDPDSRKTAAEVQAAYHRRNGRNDMAVYFEQVYEKEQEEDDLAEWERSQWQPDDALCPPDLDDALLQEWLAKLSATVDLHELYLARRVLQHRPHRVLYVMAYAFEPTLSRAQRRDALAKMNRFLSDEPMPYHCYSIDVSKRNQTYWYWQAFQKVKNTKVL